MPDDDPAFSKPVRAIRHGRWYITKTVGAAIDFVNDTLEEPERTRTHWEQARMALYEAYPDDATGMPRPQTDKLEAAEDAFRSAMKKERWLA
jgi:hypothetical protein